MTTPDPIQLRRGLLPEHRADALALYWEAFGRKLHHTLGPEPRALRFLDRALDPDFAISATEETEDGPRLLGIAGFKTREGALIGGTFADLRDTYHTLGATWRAALLGALERPVEADRLLMDGICVRAEARGRGVGTMLLEAVVDEAARRGLREVRLDVIDQNPRARALYERLGFVATETTTLGPLAGVFQFEHATTMVRAVAPHTPAP